MLKLISLPLIENLITHYGYFLILPLSIIEGPIVTVIAAFTSSLGYLNIFVVYIIVVIGDIIGDLIFYTLGHLYKKRLLNKKTFLGISTNKIEELEKHFDKHGKKTIVLGKITHSAGFAILIAAGAANMPITEFIYYNFISTLPKSLVLLLIGYYFGKNYQIISGYIDYIGIILFILLLIAIIILYLKKKNNGK